MPRTLPPAGHPIQCRMILRALLRNGNAEDFLAQQIPGSKFYFVSSGTAALALALATLKNSAPKKEVIIPAYSCPSVAAAIVKAQLEPILCDLRPYNFQMDLEQLGAKIGPKTLAIIAVHLFGIPENMLGLKKLTEKRESLLIEDAAQAFGNKIATEGWGYKEEWVDKERGSLLGTFGDIGILSFGRGKPLTLLSGGAILANNRGLLDLIDKGYGSLQSNNSFPSIHYLFNLFLYSFFYHPNFYWIPKRLPPLKLGETMFTLNFEIKRINRITLSLGRELIHTFAQIREKKQAVIELYKEELNRFKDEFIYFPECQGTNVVLLRFPIVFKDRIKRDRILFELDRYGLGATGMYPVPLNEQEGVKSYLRTHGGYPNAKFIAERIVTLPVHEEVRIPDVMQMRGIFEKYL